MPMASFVMTGFDRVVCDIQVLPGKWLAVNPANYELLSAIFLISGIIGGLGGAGYNG